MDANYFSKGKLYINDGCIEIETLEWNEHPVFKGVFLKHIIKGESTENKISCHLVKVNPGCEIGTHIHAGKSELHEILNGFGHCIIGQTKINYCKGIVSLIHADVDHSVKAEDEGLLLLAKFFPALL